MHTVKQLELSTGTEVYKESEMSLSPKPTQRGPCQHVRESLGEPGKHKLPWLLR